MPLSALIFMGFFGLAGLSLSIGDGILFLGMSLLIASIVCMVRRRKLFRFAPFPATVLAAPLALALIVAGSWLSPLEDDPQNPAPDALTQQSSKPVTLLEATPAAPSSSAQSSPTPSTSSPSNTPTSSDPAATPAGHTQALPAEDDEDAIPPQVVAVMPAPDGAPSSNASQVIADAAPQTALAALAQLEVKGRAPKTGYDRSVFKYRSVDLDRNGCDTRNDILGRDLINKTYKSGTKNCVVLTGQLRDPYSGTLLDFDRSDGSGIQIDHVVALSDAWQKGAQSWDSAKLAQFGNDPMNLLAVQGRLNSQKGAGDAATWLPPLKSYRCEYVARQVAVKYTYGLWVTEAERNAIAGILSSCPDQKLPHGSDVPKAPVTTATTAPKPSTAAPVAAGPAPKPPTPAASTATKAPAAAKTPAATKTPAPPKTPAASKAPVTTPTPKPTPTPTTAAPTKPAAGSGGGSGSAAPISKTDCPASHPIKGNQGKNGWIYHVAGESSSYSRTHPEQCFASKDAAEAAGYRAPRG